MTDFSKDQVKDLRDSIEILMDLRSLLRPYSPDFKISDAQDSKRADKLLKKTAKKLLPFFEELNLCGPPQLEQQEPESGNSEGLPGESNIVQVPIISNGVEMLEVVQDNFIFISTNSVKKRLKSLGISPLNMIVAGGPIAIEDLTQNNPNIPEKALLGIQKKILKVFHDLKEAIHKEKQIFFAYCPNDETDAMNFARIHEIEESIGGKLNPLIVQAWDKI